MMGEGKQGVGRPQADGAGSRGGDGATEAAAKVRNLELEKPRLQQLENSNESPSSVSACS